MNGHPIIEFSESEMWSLDRFVHWRHDPKFAAGVPNKKVCNRDPHDVHRIGLWGEYGTAKHFRVPFDLFISLDGDNNGPDLYIGPYSTQVKGAYHDPPILKFNTLWEFRQDIAVLCTQPRDNAIEIWGWISRRKFLQIHHMEDFGYGRRYCARHTHLLPVTRLEEIVEKKGCLPRVRGPRRNGNGIHQQLWLFGEEE